MARQVQPDSWTLFLYPPNPAWLGLVVLLLSSPRLSRQRALVVAGTAPALPGGGGARYRRWPWGALPKTGRGGDVADLREKIKGRFCLQDLGGECK